MPPKPRGAVKNSKQSASDNHTSPDHSGAVDEVRRTLIVGFHKAQHSTGSHGAQRKIIMDLLRSRHSDTATELLCAICVKTLAIQQSPDVARRHSQFVADLCKSCVSEVQSDAIALRIIAAVLPYHAAKDKTVRYSVCNTIEPLLRTLMPDVESEGRIALFDRVVNAMKIRLFDQFAPVRERAAAALSTFQEGKKDCDVTQCLLTAACHDSSPLVRRQIISNAVPKEVYFGPLFRMTRDVASQVRKAAWDSLAKAKFTHVVAFCSLLKQDFIAVVHVGMNDDSVAVKLSVTAAITKWLTRDMEGKPQLVLSKVALPATESVPVAAFASLLFTTALKAHDQTKGPLLFPLELKTGLTPANVVLWRACCEWAVANGCEEHVLPPLTLFSQVLHDSIQTFIRPNEAVCKEATFTNPEHADHVIRTLLSVVPTYEAAGHFAQMDDQVRASLTKNLSSLLKIVTDTEPGLFAEDTMRALRFVSAAHPGELDRAVGDVVRLLFSTLWLPRQFELGYDDVETFGRRDTERRNDLKILASKANLTAADASRMKALSEYVEIDTLYLLRMMHVVHQYLSFCKREDRVPSFCAHVIQLGRAQCDDNVRGLAIKALGIQCLMEAQTVHTFLPPLLQDYYASTEDARQLSPVAEATLCVIFDLLMEYPAAFFEPGGGLSHSAAAAARDRLEEPLDEFSEAARIERRRVAEAAVIADNENRIGASRLLHAARSALLADVPSLRRLATRGFAKLLSCGRLSPAAAEEFIAYLCIGVFTHEAVASQRSRGRQSDDVVGAYIFREMNFFLLSYVGSDPRRMRQFASGALLAVRLILTRRTQLATATKILRKLVTLTDAALLDVVREADPEFVTEAIHSHQLAEAEADGVVVPDDADREDVKSKKSTARGSGLTNASMRLRNLLYKHSLHEMVALELLLEISEHADYVSGQKICAEQLSRLRLYNLDESSRSAIKFYGATALASTSDPSVKESILGLVSYVESASPQTQAAPKPEESEEGLCVTEASGTNADWQQRVNHRQQLLARVLEEIGDRLIQPEQSTKTQRSTGADVPAAKTHRSEVASY